MPTSQPKVKVYAVKMTKEAPWTERVEVEHDLGVEIEIGDLRIMVTAGERGDKAISIRGRGPLVVRLGASNSFEIEKG